MSLVLFSNAIGAAADAAIVAIAAVDFGQRIFFIVVVIVVKSVILWRSSIEFYFNRSGRLIRAVFYLFTLNFTLCVQLFNTLRCLFLKLKYLCHFLCFCFNFTSSSLHAAIFPAVFDIFDIFTECTCTECLCTLYHFIQFIFKTYRYKSNGNWTLEYFHFPSLITV